MDDAELPWETFTRVVEVPAVIVKVGDAIPEWGCVESQFSITRAFPTQKEKARRVKTGPPNLLWWTRSCTSEVSLRPF